MRSQFSSGLWVTTCVLLIGVGVCLLSASAALGQDPECGVMESDPATYPDPDEFPPLPAQCFGPGGPGANVCTDDGCVIDVLVVYTPAVRSTVGGAPQINIVIGEAVDAMNIAFANSQVPSFVRLVGTAEVPYDESDDPASNTALNCLKSSSCMPLAHVLRNELKADIVSMFVGNLPGASGVSNILGSFNVVRWDFAANPGQWTFAHEMGHDLWRLPPGRGFVWLSWSSRGILPCVLLQRRTTGYGVQHDCID